MDLPATQAMGEDDLPATQQFVVNENNKKTLVGTLLINDKVYSIFSGITKIGRHPESQIFLNNETISKRHAEIEAESPEKTIFIRDLKSCNKTRINRSTLRPQSLYQIRDGDELIFGNVIAKFQLYRAIDDSLDSSCTAQDNQKTRVQIPDTPDSSMNTSSTSESDLSIIPGTQMDKTDSNFRLPKIPIRSSKSDEHRNPIIPTLGPLDLPSPLSKDKSRDDNISEVDTQRFSTKDDFENDSIYTIATQIPTNSSKAEDSENIYEMTTQRPADFDNDKDELENLETQRFDYRSSETIKCRILDSSNRKSLNVSIHSAETQKSNEYIENLETQQFDVRKSNFENEKLNDVSIYSAATQKNTCDESNSKSIKNLETQQLIDRKSNIANEKLNDVSIYSVATQKHTCNESDSKSIDNLETQQFDNTKLNVSNKKLCDVSIYSAVTQKITDNGSGESIENLETQKFDCQNSGTSRSKSRDTSIFNTSTQPNNYDKLNDSIENLETQPFDINKSNSVKGNSDDKSIHDTATQKNLNNDIGKSIENLETQPFDNKKSENLNNISESIEDVETQQFNLNDSKRLSKPKLVGREFSKSLYDAETQKCVSETIADTSFEEVETKQYMNKSIHNEFSTSITNPNIPNKSFCTAETEKYTTDKLDNKPINDLETQQYVNKTSNDEIDESTENMESLRLVDESPQMISSLSFTLQDMKTLPCTTKQKYTVCDDALQTNAKNTVESSSDSDIQKMEWESNQNNTSKHLHNSDSLKPSLSAQDIDTLIKNNEEVKSNVLDEEDDEIFSQNLIEDCPFAFLPEESVNEKESSTIQENIENKLNNSSISKISTNNINRTSKQINNKSHTIINESDSETDEEGVFSNCVSIKETNAKPSSKCDSKSKKSISTINETDSETDEDGEFSNHLSNNSECSIKKNEQDNNKNKEDSETDEEGIFSNNTINHDKSKNLSKIDKDIESDEDIFANVHEVSNTRSPGPNNSPSIRNSLNHEKSPTPDSQNAIFDDNHASNKDSIKKSEVPNDICTSHIIDQITTNTKSNQEIDDLAPTQVINTCMIDTDNFLAPTQIISKKTCEDFDDPDLAPTQKITNTESQFPIQATSGHLKNHWNEKDSIDLAPTQKIMDTQICTESQSIIPDIDKSKNIEKRNDLELNQIIEDTQPCTESELDTQVINKQTSDCSNIAYKSANIKDSEYQTTPTNTIDVKCESLLNQSKRFGELEITCNKKIKVADDNMKSDLYKNVLKNLDEMFEGPVNEPTEVNQSVILTQQLANILECSQNDESFRAELNTSKPSPTLSSGRISKLKNRRRAIILDEHAINLNDTIERNLNEMFDDNVDNMQPYKPEEMMTQQLKNVLDSQETFEKNEESVEMTKSPILCKNNAKKRHRLNLSLNLNSSLASKKHEQSLSNQYEELKETNEHFLPEMEIVYKRGTVGFSDTGKPVSTKEPVELLEPKGRSFTSDSQSDGDEFSSGLSGKKRFSLSLARHVDLNSSLSSTCPKEAEKKLSTSPPKIKGNNKSTLISHRTKKARGIRGFSSGPGHEPVETEELVSAASTESDEELRSLTNTTKKVCKSKLYRKVTVNLTKLSPSTLAKLIPKSRYERNSDSDSDEEFLKKMPCIKVAGTADCPPTNSQLIAPSDIEDDDDCIADVSLTDIHITPRCKLYANKQFDFVYRKNASNSPKTMEKKDKCEDRARSPELVKSAVRSIDEILAEIDANQPVYKRRIVVATPKCRRSRRSANDSASIDDSVDAKLVQAQLLDRALRGPSRTPESSPIIADEGSDSNSEPCIIPKYTPLPPFELKINLDEEFDSDPEFEQLRRNYERMLAKPSAYAPKIRNVKGGLTPTMKQHDDETSPVISRRRRTSALSNCNSLSITRSGGDRRKTGIYCNTGVADQSAFVFQGADGGSKAASAVTAAGSRMSSLQIIRSKRSGASDLDDAQNRPPKRSKTMPEDEERPKLQQLSQPDATTSVPRNKKRISKVPRTLDNFIVMHSPKTRTNSSDLSAVENSTDEDKQNEKSNRLRTRGKNAASKKNTKVEASIVHSNTSSKENLVVEDSDVECGPNTSNTQNVKSKTNEDISYLSLIGNSVKNETLNSDVENKNVVKTRARITRQKNSEKEAVVTKKIATVIQDSDTEESDESEFVKTKPKNNLSETDQLSNSGKSNISKNVNTKSQDKNINDSAISGKSSNIEVSVSTRMKSKRVQRIKESDKEKTDNSADTISKRNNTRKRRGSKSGDSNLEKSSDSENTVNSKTRNNQDKAVKESDSEKSDTTSNKVTRSKRIKKSDSDDSDRVVKKITNKQDGLKKQEPVIQRTRNRRAQDSASEQETVVVKNETRSRRAITRNQSSDSVFYESDNDKKTNLSLANTSSRSVRQTRKRTALTNVSTTDTPSSEESQEVAEIMSSFEENTNTRKTRRGRKVKDILSSSDTQDSESNCTNSEDVFEKPSSRPKRARLVKSTKNKSSTQNNLVDEEIKTYPSQPTSTQRITPNQEVLSTPSHSTSSRSRRTMSMSPMKGTSYKVLFTGERSEVHRKIVAKLGGSEMEDPAKCSILVTDKVRRTYKFLCCLARGIPIVSVNWLNDSGKAQRFLNWEDYILQDPIAEAKFEFKLKESLEKAVTHRLLEGYTVLLTPNITQPPISELKGMVISSGGKPLVKAPTKWPENTVIVTKEDDLISAKKIILKAPKSVTVHSTEFILTGILRQKLSLEIFKLTV